MLLIASFFATPIGHVDADAGHSHVDTQVESAPEHTQPVLYVPFGSQLDDSDDQDLAQAQAETESQFGHSASLGIGLPDLPRLLASAIQLERPPRV